MGGTRGCTSTKPMKTKTTGATSMEDTSGAEKPIGDCGVRAGGGRCGGRRSSRCGRSGSTARGSSWTSGDLEADTVVGDIGGIIDLESIERLGESGRDSPGVGGSRETGSNGADSSQSIGLSSLQSESDWSFGIGPSDVQGTTGLDTNE